jgi:stage II sporulation protein D
MLATLAIPGVASGGTVFLLDGRGWGHGVGMSQWGAEGYARHGFGYRQILAHYYPQTHLGLAGSREVRVLLRRGAASYRIGSSSPFVVLDQRGRKSHLGARVYVVKAGFRHLTFPLRFVAGAQPVRFGGVAYRGDIVVKRRPGGLMAVNVLPLDRYLRGVVPWEVPVGWHEAAYEAQAVAARSYTLATLKPGADFDLFRDERSQMYGGVAAERTETNLALGATAGQVLVWRDSIIPAYYFSTSGGRTSSVHDAWPRAQQVPYLVSVADPYDYISPHHVWPTTVLTPARVAAVLHVRDVRDLQVVDNSSGRARAVRVLGAHGWRQFPGSVIRKKFRLGSTDFQIHAMTLDDVPPRAMYATHVRVHGWVRGLGRARLEELTDQGWRAVRSIRAAPDGRFSVSIAALRSTQLRLAYNAVAGTPVPLRVAPRVRLSTDGAKLEVVVAPRLPLRVERLTAAHWRPVATARGSFVRTLRPGSYRVAVLGGPAYVPTVTRPLAVRIRAAGP